MGGRTPCKRSEDYSQQHPVEVIGRIRQNSPQQNSLNLNGNGDSSVHAAFIQVTANRLRVRMDSGHFRDFTLDGISWGGEPLQHLYLKHVQGRIEDVKRGSQCTVIMYGATGSGKSYTMFGSPKEEGIAYRALNHIMDERDEERLLVRVTVIEIYNEEIYDLLAANSLNSASANRKKTKLAVRGRKVKNAFSISGIKADEIARELQMVERRRAVKSTSCNERSSRSHCMIILDVLPIGGRLVLVDMAGSENIDQAGICMEAKMQTGKINQGNAALKRVVEAIANGDGHIPYRDSKLTMLLQDSFEDDKSKILMILCASTEPKEFHKTISTLEYGAKAKCIVKLPKSPPEQEASTGDHMILEARINVLNSLVSKLQADNKLKDECKEELERELKAKTVQLEDLKHKVTKVEREKLKLMAHFLKTDEKLLFLIDKLDFSRRRIQNTEILRSSVIDQQRAKIDELLGKMEGIETEFMGSINSQAGIIVDSSLSHYLDAPKVESTSSLVSRSVDVKEPSFMFVMTTEDRKVDDSHKPEVSLDDKNTMTIENIDKSQHCNGSEGKSAEGGLKDGSDATEMSEKDGGMLETALNTEVRNRMNNMRDWDEEVHFRLVCEDSEYKAVICRSCDQIDEFSSLSDIENEVPEPAAKDWSPANTDRLNGKSQNAYIRKVRHIECVTSNPGNNHSISKEDIYRDINSSFSSEGDATKYAATPMLEDDLSKKRPNDLSTNDGGTHQPFSVEASPDMVCADGMSFKGWLPPIPESSFEGEDDEINIHASLENHKIIDEKNLTGNKTESSICQVHHSNSSIWNSSSDSIINDFLCLNGVKSSLHSRSCEMGNTSSAKLFAETDRCQIQDGRVTNEASHELLEITSRDVILRETEVLSPDASNTVKKLNYKTEGSIQEYRQDSESEHCIKQHRYPEEIESDEPKMSQENIRSDLFSIEESACNTCSYVDYESNEFSMQVQKDETMKPSNSPNANLGPILDIGSVRSQRCNVLRDSEDTLPSNDRGKQGSSKAEAPILSESAKLFPDADVCDSSSCSVEEVDCSDMCNSPERCNSTSKSLQKETRPEDGPTLRETLSDKSMISSTELSFPLNNHHSHAVPSHSTQIECQTPLISKTTELLCGNSTFEEVDLNNHPEVPTVSESAPDACNVDVYVKWENSSEEQGRLICIVQISKSACLDQLRKAITPHTTHVNKNFSFLMFGETGEGEVAKDIENDIRVGSLPDCLGRKGCRLACLRPPRRIRFSSAAGDRITVPLSRSENQMPQDQATNKRKASKPGICAAKERLISRPNPNNARTTFRDKARAVYFRDLSLNVLNGL